MRSRTARTKGDLWLNNGHQPILLQACRLASVWLQHACWKKAAKKILNLYQGKQSSRISKKGTCKAAHLADLGVSGQAMGILQDGHR